MADAKGETQSAPSASAMRERLFGLAAQTESLIETGFSKSFFSDIAGQLFWMAEHVCDSREARQAYSQGLARLVMDDWGFMQTPLAERLMNAADEFEKY